jgi:NTP pyrophosphatase (non-canonical NTP hydrolase)
MTYEYDRPPIPTIGDFKTFQDLVGILSGKLNENETVDTLAGYAEVELQELIHAIKTGDPSVIHAEAADVIIFLTQLITMTGGALEDVLSKKIARNYAKYNPYIIDYLLKQGYTIEQARQMLKDVWPKEADRLYIK